jgi:hypothetical protein
LYSSRTRGIWYQFPHLIRLAPQGWKEKHEACKEIENKSLPIENAEDTVGVPSSGEKASAWARLIKKVYGVDPLICPKCGKDMKIISIILDPDETTKIFRFQRKRGIWLRLAEPRLISVQQV